MLMAMRIFIFLLVFPVMSVASRCANEAGWPGGVFLCSCTVKARLDAGWAEHRVLDAYYASDGKPSPEMIVAASAGLSGKDCPVDGYYLFGAGDVRWLDLDLACATATSRYEGKTVYTFPRAALQQCRLP